MPVTFVTHKHFAVLSAVLLRKVFSHDVTAAILVSQNNETAAMLVSQTNPVGVELFSYAKAFFCSNKLAKMLARDARCTSTGRGLFALLSHDFNNFLGK